MTLVDGWPARSGLLDALDTAALLTDAEGRVVAANDLAQRLYGRSDVALAGRQLVPALFGEREQHQMETVLQRVLVGDAWRGLMQLRQADGATHRVELTCSPLRDGEEVYGVAVLLEDIGGQEDTALEAGRLRERLTRLARVTSELATAHTIDAVRQIVITHSADAVGATMAALSLRDPKDPGKLRLVGLTEGNPKDQERYATYPVTDENPAAEAVRTGERIVIVGERELAARYPDAADDRGERSVVCLPLHGATTTIGAIALVFPGIRILDTAELEFFDIFADSCAQAIERIEVQEVADRQSAKLTFLAEAAIELSSSLDYEATLAKVAQLVVPEFADWSTIDLVDDGVLRRLAVAHIDPAKVRLAQELAEKYPPDPDAPTGAWNVMRTGQSEFVPEVTDEVLEMLDLPDEQKQLVRDLQLRSAVTVPLIARGRVLGVMSWIAAESGRLYSEADLALAEDLAKRAAIAIDNAELHSQTLAAAIHLQRAVLPDSMPVVDGMDVASWYRPSGRTEVGGDFYDAIPLRDGRVALFVGDVMGRGVAAAANMAQMRAAVRAYAAADPRPAAVVGALDAMFGLFPTDQLVTLAYLLVDPTTDSLTFTNAGHPPPALLRADGTTEQLPIADGAPLGTVPQERTERSVTFCAGDTVVIFTDGLIERRDEDISTGQQRVLDALPGLAADDLSAALERFGEHLTDPSRNDDVATLAARRLR
ncbi:SpoIIE family protein phosphatase [Nocardioides sp. HDW12B]|uniref:SpoIIE family protein phosphatase n=1 Tax=Nocardioides sp. HDW12B TaxID=2714939 RepID=UPI001407ABBD|nr:SpoIIE family protein phosphatase [Nocardioides sp. HDW12B]QIK67263.1 SpoIIE family protein phosphatase [Nocardioides sp. HDW12B]